MGRNRCCSEGDPSVPDCSGLCNSGTNPIALLLTVPAGTFMLNPAEGLPDCEEGEPLDCACLLEGEFLLEHFSPSFPCSFMFHPPVPSTTCTLPITSCFDDITFSWRAALENEAGHTFLRVDCIKIVSGAGSPCPNAVLGKWEYDLGVSPLDCVTALTTLRTLTQVALPPRVTCIPVDLTKTVSIIVSEANTPREVCVGDGGGDGIGGDPTGEGGGGGPCGEPCIDPISYCGCDDVPETLTITVETEHCGTWVFDLDTATGDITEVSGGSECASLGVTLTCQENGDIEWLATLTVPGDSQGNGGLILADSIVCDPYFATGSSSHTLTTNPCCGSALTGTVEITIHE